MSEKISWAIIAIALAVMMLNITTMIRDMQSDIDRLWSSKVYVVRSEK